MDDLTALDRLLTSEVQREAGPSQPVNDAAIFTAITATRSPKWRFTSMFSATKFVVAGAIVALFGGFLLAGLLVAPRGEDMAPAAVSPSPTTTDELLVGMATEEVEPGAYRVDSDGIRSLSRPMGTSRPDYDPIHNGMEGDIAAGLDGSVWWFDQDGFFRLGEPGVHSWPNDRANTFLYRDGLNPNSLRIDLEVGPDGTVWLARHSLDAVRSNDDTSVWEDEISSYDGESWSVHQQHGEIVGVEVLQDGEVWGAWVHDGSDGTVARLGDAGWEPLPRVLADGGHSDLSVAGDSEVWLLPGDGRRLQRFDGSGWEQQMTPDVGGEMAADVAPDGTLWVGLSRDCGPGTPGNTGGGSCHGGYDMLARFDGTDWEVFDAGDGIPPGGHHFARFWGFLEAAADGSVWFDPTVLLEEDSGGWDCDGVANFDGEAVTRYLRGMCIYAMDVAPEGAVWVQAGRPGDDDPQPIHTYVITREAVK